jgi:hypothetical protein
MESTTMRPLVNMAHLKTDIAKNRNISHFNENNLIRLISLQGTQICAQNQHASSKTLNTKSSSGMKLPACHWKGPHGNC